MFKVFCDEAYGEKLLEYKVYIYILLSEFYLERSLFIVYYYYIGLSITQIVLIQGVISGVQFLGEIPTGVFSDMIGRKKTMMLGTGLVILYYTLMSISKDFGVIIVANLLYGLGLTFRSGADESYIYENSSEFIKVYKTSTIIASMSIGAAILVGGIISTISWRFIFVLGAIIQILAFCVISTLSEKKVPLKKVGINIQVKEYIDELKDLIKSKEIVNIILFLTVDSFFWFYYMASQSQFTQVNVGSLGIAVIYFMISCVVFFVNLIGNRISVSTSDGRLRILMSISAVAGVILNNVWIFVIMLLMTQVYLFRILPKYAERIHDAIKDDKRNQIMSTVYSISSLFIFVFFLIYGLLQRVIGLRSLSIMLLVVVIILLKLNERVDK